MVHVSIPRLGLLEGRSPTLFLGAGVLLLGYMTLRGIVAVTDAAVVPLSNLLAPAGFVLGFLGLLALAAKLESRDVRLVRAGAVCVGLGAVGFSVILLQELVALTGGGSTGGPGIALLAGTLGLIPGYLCFGAALLRASSAGRSLGLLVCVPAIVFAAMLSQPFVYTAIGVFSEPVMAWSNFAISTMQALAHLAIGIALRARVATDATELSVPAERTG